MGENVALIYTFFIKLKTYTPPFVGYFQYTADFSTWHIKCVHSIKGLLGGFLLFAVFASWKVCWI